MPTWHFSKPRIPVRAVIIAIAALIVPFVETTFRGTETTSSGLLWLLALIPAFLLAYYRGWRGVATALAAGMAVLTLAVCIVSLQGEPDLRPEVLLPVTTAYIVIALAAGALSERMHRNRADAEMLALTDELTGLANRRRARMVLAARAADAQRQGTPFSVIMFDLDRFKAYNDHNGHPAGDQILCAFADVLKAAAREGDLVVRYGGEEFLAVLAGSDETAATAFAENVRVALHAAQTGSERITVSAGLATYGGALQAANDLIVAADRALYYAKQNGRDRVCIATQARSALV
jgi:diguanylate cyclase (GGDEF)-like protein